MKSTNVQYFIRWMREGKQISCWGYPILEEAQKDFKAHLEWAEKREIKEITLQLIERTTTTTERVVG